MTLSHMQEWLKKVSLVSVLLPLLISLGYGANSAVANRLTAFLHITNTQTTVTAQVGGSDSEPGVPASNLPGQPLKVNKTDSGATSVQPSAPQSPDASVPSPDTMQPSTTVATAGEKPAGEYTVKDGDTYGCIAEAYYGSYEQYPIVMAANYADTAPGYGEYHLDVGAKVVLPAVTGTQVMPVTHLCK